MWYNFTLNVCVRIEIRIGNDNIYSLFVHAICSSIYSTLKKTKYLFAKYTYKYLDMEFDHALSNLILYKTALWGGENAQQKMTGLVKVAWWFDSFDCNLQQHHYRCV